MRYFAFSSFLFTVVTNIFVSIFFQGYYAPSLTAEYTEDSHGGDSDDLARLCAQWEASAKLPESHSHVRRVTVRIGQLVNLLLLDITTVW